MAKPTSSSTVWAFCWLLLLAVSQSASAVGVSIRGVIFVPPSCTVNGGSTINVPFGNDLMTTRIDGVNYRKTVPYTVTCTGLPSNGLTMKLQGVGAGFNSTLLSTNNVNLGIKFFINGVSWPLNSNFNFTAQNLPTMEAVPVKKPASSLSTGAFSASATLLVVLQ